MNKKRRTMLTASQPAKHNSVFFSCQEQSCIFFQGVLRPFFYKGRDAPFLRFNT